MTNQEIIDNNRLIAIFMNNYQKLSNDPEFGRFHLQWDWLMPVVDKIYSNDKMYLKNLEETSTQFYNGGVELSTKLNRVYKQVIDYIKWYNEQNK